MFEWIWEKLRAQRNKLRRLKTVVSPKKKIRCKRTSNRNFLCSWEHGMHSFFVCLLFSSAFFAIRTNLLGDEIFIQIIGNNSFESSSRTQSFYFNICFSVFIFISLFLHSPSSLVSQKTRISINIWISFTLIHKMFLIQTFKCFISHFIQFNLNCFLGETFWFLFFFLNLMIFK